MDNTINNEEILDNGLLSKLDLVDYDISRTYYNVCKFMKHYRRLKGKNYFDPPIQITTKYKYVYVDERTKGINDYSKIDEYIDKDTEYQNLSKKICLITKRFSQEELVYFTTCIYHQQSEYKAYKEIGCSSHGLIPIKNSCILKFALALDIEVDAGNKFDNPDDEEKYRIFNEEYKL